MSNPKDTEEIGHGYRDYGGKFEGAMEKDSDGNTDLINNLIEDLGNAGEEVPPLPPPPAPPAK